MSNLKNNKMSILTIIECIIVFPAYFLVYKFSKFFLELEEREKQKDTKSSEMEHYMHCKYAALAGSLLENTDSFDFVPASYSKGFFKNLTGSLLENTDSFDFVPASYSKGFFKN